MDDTRSQPSPPTLLVAPCDDADGWCVRSRGHVVARAESRSGAELRAFSRLINIGGGQLVVRNGTSHR